MGEYSRREAADRVGIEPEELDRLIDLGAATPEGNGRFTASGVRKIGLIAAFRSSGVPDDVIAGEIKSGRLALDFFDNPVFESFTALTDTTFAELAAARSLPVELVLVIREAVGSAVAEPSDRVRESELGFLPAIEAALESGYEPAEIERLFRTLGDGLRRFVLAEADAFRRFVIGPVGNRPGREISAVAEAAVQRMSGAFETAVRATYEAQRANAWTANLIEGVEYGLAAAGIHGTLERPPAMCFLDITGYTALTAERGDAAAAQLADTLGRLVQRTSIAHGGRPVKWLGDGVMCYFRDPGRAVLAALEMSEGVVTAGLPPAHVGLHAGPVLFQDGDYFGLTVNLAARIAAYARPGEVLVSDSLVQEAAGSPVAFSEIGPVNLKGVPEPIRLFAARRPQLD